ncbi:MAG: bifunctional proline dehydrogenase/L-glutamate gamma-semialdehyde dehydrogenase [Armatimonadetes bacterium]|nr:bifunctional proline dehydrogenase/L-glutamate gamma-semialdehyde dehydrogenase [Armatimonadota bacterium]
MEPRELEAQVQLFGADLWKQIAGEVPGLFNRDFWQGKLMDWAMADPDFKTDLFRLVDVMPVLTGTEPISEHVREYLQRDDRDLGAVLGGAIKLASGGLTAGLAARTIRANITGLAERFIVGQDAKTAVATLRGLRREGLAFTCDLLGETTVSESESAAYQARYLDLIDHLTTEAQGWKPDPRLDRDHRGPIPRVNVSVKVSAMSACLDPVDIDGSIERALERVRPLFVRAAQKGALVNLDLEQYAIRPIILGLFERLAMDPELREYPHLGVVIQAYLTDAANDAQRVIELARRRGAPLTVRLVKGAYWQYEVALSQQNGHRCPVFTEKPATDANYEAVARQLLEASEHISCAFASHNVRSMTAALVTARSLGLPPEAIEAQMLYGMGDPERKAVRNLGYRVRVYSPVGDLLPGVAYLVRRLLENTSNSGFLRLSHHDGVDVAQLLAAPSAEQAAPLPAPALDTGYTCCPLTDFADPARQSAFGQAVTAMRARLPLSVPVAVAGRDRLDAQGVARCYPGDGDTVVSQVTMATEAEADTAAAAAWAAWPAWRDTPLAQRVALLDRLGDILARDRDTLSALCVWEVGKPWREADADVAEAVDFCRYYARQAEPELGHRACLSPAGEANEMWYEGRGPTVVIAPWNFPLAILTGMAAAALVAGNTVLLKPSSLSAAVAHGLYRACVEAGFPTGVVQFLPGPGEKVGMRLVEHPKVAQVAFTGGREVGLSIVARAAQTSLDQPQVRRVVCEMGGKNAIIVDEDADLDEAVAGVVKSAFGFAGQKCSACSRVIVVGSAAEHFTERLLEACRSLLVTAPHDPACQVPPLADPKAAERLMARLAQVDGAKLLHRGTVPAEGWYLPPMLFEVADANHWLMQEELFAPVLALHRVPTFEAALDVALGTRFFLTGAVFSRLPSHLELARQRFRVGNLYLNRGCTGAVVGRQPFGGHGHSGIGTKAGGPNYLLQFADPRVCSENTMRRGMMPELQS